MKKEYMSKKSKSYDKKSDYDKKGEHDKKGEYDKKGGMIRTNGGYAKPVDILNLKNEYKYGGTKKGK